MQFKNVLTSKLCYILTIVLDLIFKKFIYANLKTNF